MNPLPLILIVATTLMAATSASAQVNRCKTASGKIVYTDAPCPTASSGGRVKLTDNVSENRAQREREALARQQQDQLEAERQPQQQRVISQPGSQPTATRTPSYKCRLAISNANTQSTSASARKIDADRAVAVEICGYNPWPGATLTEIDAANRRSAAMKAQADAKMQQDEEPWRGPATITSCDAAGCWGSDGKRYNNAAGGFLRNDGKFCPKTGAPVLFCN